ncbi:unnamed protein product [Strongylus vulgaris]|uniref:Uncharacterized protein n=1 Tax=Strongylus vulgaris TaxID=40348 RepID=A0A3P7KS03_STRVU|nr:unnamed protein product [Strongylus vulgaris]
MMNFEDGIGGDAEMKGWNSLTDDGKDIEDEEPTTTMDDKEGEEVETKDDKEGEEATKDDEGEEAETKDEKEEEEVPY